MHALAEVIRLLRPQLVAQANRQILVNVAFWPTGKKGKLPRRKAKQLSIVKRLKKSKTA